MEGVPFANGAPNLTVDIPAMRPARHSSAASPIGGKDFKTGQTLMKTVLAPMFKARMLGCRRLVLDQHPRQPRRRGARRSGELQDEGRVEARRARAHPPADHLPRPLRQRLSTRCGSTTTRRAATTRRAGTTSTSSGGSAIRCRSRSTSSAATRSSRRRSCSTSPCSSTSRSAPSMNGIQEWLSFYFKSPAGGPGLYPEHDLFIQQTKLKNTLALVDGRRTDHPPRHRVLSGSMRRG